MILFSLSTCYSCLLVFGTIAVMGPALGMASRTVKPTQLGRPLSPLSHNLLFPLLNISSRGKEVAYGPHVYLPLEADPASSPLRTCSGATDPEILEHCRASHV